METCRLCPDDAVVIMILDDGARVPYCRKHMPGKNEEEEAFENFAAILRLFRG